MQDHYSRTDLQAIDSKKAARLGTAEGNRARPALVGARRQRRISLGPSIMTSTHRTPADLITHRLHALRQARPIPEADVIEADGIARGTVVVGAVDVLAIQCKWTPADRLAAAWQYSYRVPDAAHLGRISAADAQRGPCLVPCRQGMIEVENVAVMILER